jgi:hypothetical protein
MSINLFFLILAMVSFFLGAFNVPKLNWLCLGLAFVVCSWIFAGSLPLIR